MMDSYDYAYDYAFMLLCIPMFMPLLKYSYYYNIMHIIIPDYYNIMHMVFLYSYDYAYYYDTPIIRILCR